METSELKTEVDRTEPEREPVVKKRSIKDAKRNVRERSGRKLKESAKNSVSSSGFAESVP